MINILSLHKSGSTLQNKIYKHINKIAGQQIAFSRARITWLQVLYLKKEELKNTDIIVIRNPINRLISHYYSAFCGKNKDDNNVHNFGCNDNQRLIRSYTLSEWIVREKFLLKHKNLYDLILDSNNLHIIRYEDMMDQPKQFISFILNKINRLDLLETVYEKWKGEFIFNIPDLSDKIANQGIISHRRILDHNEYLKKFTKKELQTIDNILHDTLDRYNKIKSFG
tara:strand:- start:197 stop:871 length:675 start_codon:yes stop_codon:yes gene_type:complete